MRFISLIIISVGFIALSNAADVENGNLLHSKSCTACHGSEMYTRANRRVQTLPQLGAQVRFCISNLGISWFDNEVEDVTDYLNENYYHF